MSGYAFADRREASDCAEPANGPSVEAWAAAALRHDVVVVGGFPELAGGRLYNSAALVDPSGIRAVYRKLHLWNREKLVFEPGEDPPPLVDTPAGRIGVGVCYDIVFPELTRRLALEGADILAFPTNSPVIDDAGAPWSMEVVVAASTAYVNRVFVVVTDRCGLERGIDWVGGSVIVAPGGRMLAGPPSAGSPAVTLIADCDVGESRDKRWGPRNDVFGDRRSDVLPGV